MTATFESFGLQPALVKGLTRMGLTVPTPVQQQAIPLVLQGKDAIVQAKTGSGKTLSFGLPVLSLLQPRQRPQALVILPTRELALQVCAALAEVSQDSKLKTVALYGGVGLEPQERALRGGIDVVVGTPGRLKDLQQRGSLDLRDVRILILDEADEMLDMGFRRDIEFMLDRLPAREQTLILSATLPPAIEVIARKHMHDPVVVKLTATDAIPTEISHHFVRLHPEQRLAGLVALLKQETPERAIIFTRMKHETKRLAEKLQKTAGMKAGFLNGNMSQNARNRMMDDFRSGAITYLVATDVAARGLHVDGLSHVIHYAVPPVVETYIHRSGRTGRAGNEGKTIIFVTPESEADFKAINKQMPCDEILASSLGLTGNLVPEGMIDRPSPPPERRGRNQQPKKPAARQQDKPATAPRPAAEPRTGRPAAESRTARPAADPRVNRQNSDTRPSRPAADARNAKPAGRPAPERSNGNGRTHSNGEPSRWSSGEPAQTTGMADAWNRAYPKR